MSKRSRSKTNMPIHRESLFWILSPVFCLLSPVSCLLPYPPILPSFPALYESIMQNKPNVKIGKINISTAIIKTYATEQRTMNNEHYPKQTQSNPIPNAQTAYPACRTRDCHPFDCVQGRLPRNDEFEWIPPFAALGRNDKWRVMAQSAGDTAAGNQEIGDNNFSETG